MAIKIIKQGKITKFTKTCPDCECEFEYEQDDIKVDYSCCLTTYPCKYGTYVICPCCGKHLHHGYTTPAISSYPNITYTATATSWQDCDTCQFKPDQTKTAVGDTPYTWCRKNQPYCYTGDVFPKDYKVGSYKVAIDPEQYKNTGYTSTSYQSPAFTANYTTEEK